MKRAAKLTGLLLALSLVAVPCQGADGTVAHYTFDEGSGTVLHDSSGNGYDGTLQNSPTWTTGIVNGALDFDGTNYVSVPNSPDVSGASFTVTAWIYRAGGLEQKFVSKWNDNTGAFQFDCQIYTDSKAWFQVRQADNTERIAQGTTVIQTGQWYHYAGVADTAAHQLRIYINGVLETLQYDPGWDGTIRPQTMEMDIGRKATGNGYWQGLLDDVRIYNRALTQAEIHALAEQPPVSANDNYAVGIGTSLSIPAPGVLANDTDLNQDPLTALKLTNPAHGTVTLNADGSFTYVPNGGFSGADSFTYKANDGQADSLPATVTINVTSNPPKLSVTASESIPLAFTTYSGGPAPGDKTLQLSNAGDYSFTWSVSSDSPWLSVTPASGTATTGNTPLTVHVNVSTLDNAHSPYSGNLTFTAVGALNAPLTVPVKVLIAPPNRLLAYYSLDENAGTIAHDTSGGGHDGALIGNPTWSPGVINSGLTFNGSTQYGEVSNTAGLDIHTSDFTLAAWVRPTNLVNEQMIVSRDRDDDPHAQFRLELLAGGAPAFYFSNPASTDGVALVAASPVPLNQWSHVAIVRSGATFTLYVNGLTVKTGTTATLIDHVTAYNVRIGARYALTGTGAERWFSGGIDEINWFGRALSPQEVAVLGSSAITDTSGNVLDGENNGVGVLSGDGNPGGNYVQTFTIATPKLQVAQITPAANATVTTLPANVTVAFSKPVDAATVTAATFRVLQAGADGQFGTSDDITLAPVTVTMIDAQTAKLDLSNVQLPNGTYQIRLTGTGNAPITDVNGNILDGDGDNVAGGDFTALFTTNVPPAIVSAATATPNPARVNDSIAFTVSAQSSPNDTLTYAWDFGDGNQGTGSNVTHAYGAAGTYAAVVTVTGSGGTVISSVSVVVNTPDAPPGGPATPTVPFTITKMSGTVNFKKSNHDAVKLAGILPNVAPPFSPLGTALTVNIDGAQATFTLDKNGHARSANGAVVLKPVKSAKNKTFGGDLNFTVQLTGSFASTWNINPNTTVIAQVLNMPTTVVLNGTTYQTTVAVEYSGKAKVSGKFAK